MTLFAPHEIIPSAYRGREQAYIKHLLLEGYLERLLYIIGWNASNLGLNEVAFVDCFSGPWQDESENLSSTSIAISLRLLEKIQVDLANVGHVVKFRAIYVEQNATAFSRLKKFLLENSPDNVATTAINGDFVEQIPTLLTMLRSDCFAFFFIDPKGWLTVRPNILEALLNRSNSEFLINFMYDFVNRTVSMPDLKKQISELFDGAINLDQLPQEPTERERFLLEKFRLAVISRSQIHNLQTMSAYVTILDPLKDRTKYHLLYITRHPLGVIEFMKQSEILDGIQNTVRAAAKLEKNNANKGMDDLFGIDTDQIEMIGGSNLEHVENYVLTLFEDNSITMNRDVFASILCRTNCFPSELQAAIKILIDKNLAVIPGVNISRRRKNFINYDKKEQLKKI